MSHFGHAYLTVVVLLLPPSPLRSPLLLQENGENQLSNFADPHASRGTSDPHVMYITVIKTLWDPWLDARRTHHGLKRPQKALQKRVSRQLGNDMS